MDFKQLSAFVTVVELRSFSKAAERLYLSQPTISAQIRNLEAELKTPLLARTTKTVRLTSAGQEVYEYACGILTIQKKIRQSCFDSSAKTIRIGASTIPSAYLLPDVLSDYQADHPTLQFELRQGSSRKIIDGVITGLHDVGFVGVAPEDGSLDAFPVWQDRLVLISAPQEKFQNLQRMKPIPVREILSEPMIMREEGSGSLQSAEQFLRRIGLTEDQLNIIARVDDTEAIKRMVARGMGVTVISDLAIQGEVKNGELLLFPTDEFMEQRDFFHDLPKKPILET